MDLGDFALKFLIILFPGIIATLIFKKLIIKRHWETYEIALNILMLGIMSYLLLQLILSCCTSQTLDAWSSFEDSNAVIPYMEVLSASGVGIILSFIAAALHNYKVINKIGRYIGVSVKYGDDNLFYHFLSKKEVTNIYVRDKVKDLTYHGKLIFYSEDNDVREIVLEEVDVYRYSDSEFCYRVPMIYLSSSKTEGLVIELEISKNQ